MGEGVNDECTLQRQPRNGWRHRTGRLRKSSS
jgi:hypothetical protein